MKKILVANRGEIAVRVIRACREMGMRSTAVYSDADRGALHTRLADEAVRIGPSTPAESYLNIERVLNAAREAGADAVHPGYGFLSENADFAEAVRAAGLVFIGPSAEAIRLMGDKAAARARMEAAGVPVVPGYSEEPEGFMESEEFHEAASEIGYPVMVKAAAGGGGKGMRTVWEPASLAESAESARREATNAFGDGRLILEKYIPQSRHIEFQVLADSRGATVHLFERECSIQRRHQKVVEESPSIYLDETLRGEMGAAATAAARAAGYENAGTIEFLVDTESRRFYFLEMNTRLQVEHPVTELVAGLDLVALQIRIAAGEALPFSQEDLVQRGHAIECRIYAEDPSADFLPAAGQLYKVIEPQGPGIRIDSGVSGGEEIGVHYDPLLSKLIVHAEDRVAAIRRMRAALDRTAYLGLRTNLAFLRAVMDHPAFRTGETHTSFIEEHFKSWEPPRLELPAEVLIAAAILESRTPEGTPAAARLEIDPFNPWERRDSFRLGGLG
jgi:acetyl-CoA carboxylase biotin carboxylase subunit